MMIICDTYVGIHIRIYNEVVFVFCNINSNVNHKKTPLNKFDTV